MKILLIASFLDEEVRKQDIFKKDSLFFHKLVRFFGLPERVGKLSDHGPWVRSIISFLEKQEDVELHVFGPQIRLKKHLTEFELRGVNYHFYSSEWTSLLRKLKRYRLWKKLQRAGHYTRIVVDKVKPDIVVLSGAENPATSEKYPRYCLCQTIYNNPERLAYSTPQKINQETEKDIFTHLQYFGVYCKKHYDLLKVMRPDATIFKFGYPSGGKMHDPVETEKLYDFVNFALIHDSRKGTPDSIRALAIVKQKFPNVTLNIVGGCDEGMRLKLENLINDLSLKENVVFTPFFEQRKDVLLHIQKSRFAVLPCKMDHISGTMNQSMQLGLPLVVYKTTGTPLFNRKKECALIAEKDNVEELANHMITLMEHPEKAELLARNARDYQEIIMNQKTQNGAHLVANFKAIIDNFHNDSPIPQEQLFNPEMEE